MRTSEEIVMTTDYAVLSDLPCSKEQIENCIYSKWYPAFKRFTPKCRIIKPLPNEFIRYLEQDGIKLPPPEHEASVYTRVTIDHDGNTRENWEKQGKQESDEMRPIEHFLQVHQQIKDIIQELGPVTPKLNWSSPRDATWILPNNTTKCSEVNEVYLLLNASNYIMHDLELGHELNCEFELVLRQWFALNPALEFRIFVKDGKVVGVSQRDLNYYHYLHPLADQFKNLFDKFVKEVMIPRFPDKSFVIDVYLPRPFEKVYLIDINPFTRKTDPLLFSWNELINFEAEGYDLRLISENNIGRFASKEHSENQVPRDVVDASLDPNAIRELAEKWTKLLEQQQAESDSE